MLYARDRQGDLGTKKTTNWFLHQKATWGAIGLGIVGTPTARPIVLYWDLKKQLEKGPGILFAKNYIREYSLISVH